MVEATRTWLHRTEAHSHPFLGCVEGLGSIVSTDGHVSTIEEEVSLGRHRRYSVKFKVQATACQGPGVSLAAVALHHKLNANLLRRWVEQAEGNDRVLVARSEVSVQSAPAIVPLPLETRNARTSEIRVEGPVEHSQLADIRDSILRRVAARVARILRIDEASNKDHQRPVE